MVLCCSQENYLRYWEGCIYIQCEAPDDVPPVDQQAFRSLWITVFKKWNSGSQNLCVKASHVAQNELSTSSQRNSHTRRAVCIWNKGQEKRFSKQGSKRQSEKVSSSPTDRVQLPSRAELFLQRDKMMSNKRKNTTSQTWMRF